MKRKIIKIDEEKCNGCGLCMPNCPEGALQIIDGKARLVSDLFCDGLGACIGHCPEGAIEVEERGAGEILLTSIDKDGTKDGYDILLTKKIVSTVSIPVIASGGCGKPEDMLEIFKESDVDAALAASIFHYETHSVNRVKEILKRSGVPVRI